MSADQAIHFFLFFLYHDCLVRVPNHVWVLRAGSVLLARHLPLREGGMVLDRIIHEAPAYLKPHRTCSHRSTMTKASEVPGAAVLFLYERDRRKLS